MSFLSIPEEKQVRSIAAEMIGQALNGATARLRGAYCGQPVGVAAGLRVECLKLAAETDIAELGQIVRLAGQFEEFCLAGPRSEDRLICLRLVALDEAECIIERAGVLAAFVEAGCRRDG